MYERVEECPLCGNARFKNYHICKDNLVSAESFAITECLSCGLLFTNPRPGKDTIAKYYNSAQYLSHNKSGTLLGRLYTTAQRYTLWSKYRLVSSLPLNTKKLLDYGCGTGGFLSYMKTKGWQTVGIEPAGQARVQAEQQGLKVYPDIDAASAAESKPEVITLWHVLEHVHDLNETIKRLRKLLAKGGYLIVAVPNIGSWDATYYQQHWAAFDVPRHLYHFRDHTLIELLKNHKLTFIKKYPMYLDSFYVSILSEGYKTGRQNLPKSIINGCKSNIYGYKTGQYSSMIYLFKKK